MYFQYSQMQKYFKLSKSTEFNFQIYKILPVKMTQLHANFQSNLYAKKKTIFCF